MKLLVISAAFPPMRSGEAEHAHHLCRRLGDRGVDVHVMTGRSKSAKEAPLRLCTVMAHWGWQDALRLVRVARRFRPDAVLLIYSGWLYDSHPMITFAPLLFKILLPRIPFVTQLEIEYTSIKASLAIRIVLKILSRFVPWAGIDYGLGALPQYSTGVIVLSELHRQKLLAKYPSLEGRCVAIPPPPIMQLSPDRSADGRDEVRKSFGAGRDDLVLVYFGYIYASKGIESLLRALQIICSRRSDVSLVVLGGASEASESVAYVASVQRLAADLGIASRVSWVGGYDSESDKASRYLWAADVCVLPFDRGVALNRSSLAAAATHGLPVVTTRGERLEPQFVDGENVLLCPPQNHRAIADAVMFLLEQPEARAKLGAGAAKLARECFSWERALDQTLDALRPAWTPGPQPKNLEASL